MTQRARFSPRELLYLLKNLGTLAVSADGRQLIACELERAIRCSQMGGVMLDRVRIMYAYFRDSGEPLQPKLLIGAALLYLIIPNDLIPDWVPVIGLTDDFAAIAIIWKQLQDVLLHYEERRLQRELMEEAS